MPAQRRFAVYSSFFSFATDFHDEGVNTALDRIQNRAGVDAVTMASVYHHGRDIFPHSPRRKVRFLEGGTAFFRPQLRRYAATPIRPIVSALAQEWDALAELRTATTARGMQLHAWTVFAHNTRLGSEHPDAAITNVYGDPQITYLCPANPYVVEYCRALAADIARYEVDSLLAESLHFHPLEHGFHHERYLIDIGPIDRLLLGLCFCPHCQRAARDAGVDPDRLATAVRHRLDRIFETAQAFDPTEPTLDAIAGLWDGDLLAFLQARERSVTAAATAVSDALDGTGVRFAFMDQAGALKGYADGLPKGGLAPEVSWQIGVDPAALSECSDEIQVMGYAQSPDRITQDISAYRTLLRPGCDVRLALRPIPPDCNDADNLVQKLRVARRADVAGVDLYHYGFARLETLDLVRDAVMR